MEAAVGASALTPAHVETVFRTNVLGAYAAGQKAVLAHPAVRSEFPYVAWYATRDTRVRPDHRAMETAGLDGTNVFRADDPALLAVWPPAGWNCRCKVVLLTLEDAAARGVREAIAWLASGLPPARPQFVAAVPLVLPAGWARGVA